MPSLKNLVRRNPNRPTLRERAAALKASAKSVMTREPAKPSAIDLVQAEVAPADLAEACLWTVEHRGRISEVDHLDLWNDAAASAEDDKVGAVFKRAISEPSRSLRDVLAKSALALNDFETFTFLYLDPAKNAEIEAKLDDGDRIVWTVLREAAALWKAEAADGALLALEAEYWVADAARVTASDRLDEASERYTGPAMPVALRVWNNDWIYSSIPRPRIVDLGGGRCRTLPYGETEVEHLRANPCMCVGIGGTEGERLPGGGYLRPDKKAQERADAIVAAWDEWQAAIAAGRDAADLPAREAAYDEARARCDAASAAIRQARAVSLTGLAVKARVALDLVGHLNIREAAETFDDNEETGLLYTLAADLADIAGEPLRG